MMPGCTIFTIALWIQTIMVPVLAILLAVEAYFGYQMAKRLMILEIKMTALAASLGIDSIDVSHWKGGP